MRDIFKGHPFGGSLVESSGVVVELLVLVVGVWLVLRFTRLLERASSGSVVATGIAAAVVHVGVFAVAEVFAVRHTALLTSAAAPLELLVTTRIVPLVLFVVAAGTLNQSLPQQLRMPVLVAPLMWGFRLVERVMAALKMPHAVIDAVKGPLILPVMLFFMVVQMIVVIPLSLGVVMASIAVPAGIFASAVFGVASVFAGGGNPNGHGGAAVIVVAAVVFATWLLSRPEHERLLPVPACFARRRVAVASLSGVLALYLAAFVPGAMAWLKVSTIAAALARMTAEPAAGVVDLIQALGVYGFVWAGLSSTIHLAMSAPLGAVVVNGGD